MAAHLLQVGHQQLHEQGVLLCNGMRRGGEAKGRAPVVNDQGLALHPEQLRQRDQTQHALVVIVAAGIDGPELLPLGHDLMNKVSAAAAAAGVSLPAARNVSAAAGTPEATAMTAYMVGTCHTPLSTGPYLFLSLRHRRDQWRQLAPDAPQGLLVLWC